MRIRSVLPFVFVVEMLPAHGQVRGDWIRPCWSAGPVVPDRNYEIMASNENWSWLRDPTLRQDFWDRIKYIRLRNHRDDWYLSIGGQTRQVWERIGND